MKSFLTSTIVGVLLLGQVGCSHHAVSGASDSDVGAAAISHRKSEGAFLVGEALVGDSNEMAHVTVTIGAKDGPAGVAFANALARQSEGHTCQLVVLEPNLPVKPSTAMVEVVTDKSMKQAVNFIGPVQSAIAHAVVDSVREGVINKADAESLVIICCPFLHPSAEDKQKIYQFNHEATKLAIRRAFAGEPTVAQVLNANAAAEK